jgi:hypothetical protein
MREVEMKNEKRIKRIIQSLIIAIGLQSKIVKSSVDITLPSGRKFRAHTQISVEVEEVVNEK